MLSSTASASATSLAGAALTPAIAGCGLPVTTDVYDGFRVGVPKGWDVSTLDGEISVAPVTGGEGALVYPVLLKSGVTAVSLFNAFLKYEAQSVSKEGGTLSYLEHAGTEPSASLRLREGGAVLIGHASVLVLPLKTAAASRIGVLFADWAPQAQYAASSKMLAAIGTCYRPERATLFQVFKSGLYTFVMPPGWEVSQEGENYFELSGFDGAAGVTYELWGPFEKGVNSTVAITSPASAISYLFSLFKIDITRVISAYTTPAQRSGAAVDDQEYVEFAAILNGKPDHGLVYVNTSIGSGVASGVIRLTLASPSLWNAINGGLIEMMGSVQHNFSQDLQQIQSVNQQWQDFSGQVADFDDILNSQQLVQDPSTGTYYEAPYSSWEPDGPDGAGYYLPNGQPLSPVQRS